MVSDGAPSRLQALEVLCLPQVCAVRQHRLLQRIPVQRSSLWQGLLLCCLRCLHCTQSLRPCHLPGVRLFGRPGLGWRYQSHRPA